MAFRHIVLFGLCAMVPAWAEDTSDQQPRDLFLGEAFYYAQQGLYFDAISRLDAELEQYYRVDERMLDPLHIDSNYAEFSVGDFELSYRMHRKAGRAIQAVLEGDVDQQIKNEAAYRLARIFYEKGEKLNAIHTIDRIEGTVPESVRNDERLLRAQIYTVNGRFSEAIDILEKLEKEPGYEGFAGYNRGIALILSGEEKKGLAQLDKTGQIQVSKKDEPSLGIRDKANLVLGYRLLEAEQPEEAKQYLDRVRLEGPFSNKALLGSGWSDVAAQRFDRALVPWTILFKRNPTNKAVQESLLGVPYAYANLEMHGRAALLYGSALDAFSVEKTRLNDSIESIRNGNFFKAMVREEIKLDSNWLIRLRELPETPETFYLMDLMASNDFQVLLKNYLDLEDMRRRMIAWVDNLDAYEDMIEMRRRYYEPLLPGIDARFRELDSRILLRMEQRDSIKSRLERLLVAPQPEMLVTADERIVSMQLDQLEEQYRNDDTPSGEEARRRIARLRGVLRWDVSLDYQDRLTEAFEHLQELEADVQRMETIYASYVRTRQAATQSYQGYEDQIVRARAKIDRANKTVAHLMNGVGHMLEKLAINELQQRRDRIDQYQIQARFAMAESYDRAVKAQQDAAQQKMMKAIEANKEADTSSDEPSEAEAEEQTDEKPVDVEGEAQ
ncbi:coiled-coil domain-containing protein [Alcanivorax sediminis]|uniref:Tetratricopeptide repeat protein n=1 Tax=Alcanivorax sediminis TaxID=2663008 RepID=A0A6N7LNZ3_9GAMM|nr:hypothetical protein [Alcanivorax sediminis]MQX51818.1 hypothetical protein [Alcanivorax sediminis]